MSIVLPTFSPAKPHSLVDVGHYVADDSTMDQLTTLKVSSTLQGSSPSYVVRADVRKNAATAGLPDINLAGYIVIRGDIADFTVQEKLDIINRVTAVLTSASGANITRIERGER